MPSHRAAILESIANVAAGALINVTLCQWLIFPLLRVPVRLDQNIALTATLTVIALLRNYAVRRFFVALAASPRTFIVRRSHFAYSPSTLSVEKMARSLPQREAQGYAALVHRQPPRPHTEFGAKHTDLLHPKRSTPPQ